MALSLMIRRASSSPLLPLALAIRAVGSPRTFHKAIPNIFNSSESVKDCKDNIQAVKKLVDDNLLRVIETEIKNKEYVPNKIPKKFPFNVTYSENGTIELEREYLDEVIKVEVELAKIENDEDESDSDSSSSDEKDKDGDSVSSTCSDSDSDSKSDKCSNDSDCDCRVCIPFYVDVSKGSNLSLRLAVNALPDEISIQGMGVKESKGGGVDAEIFPAQEFGNVNDNLKEALHKYLEVRGIDVSMANILHQYYRYHKRSQENFLWLKKFKKFIKK